MKNKRYKKINKRISKFYNKLSKEEQELFKIELMNKIQVDMINNCFSCEFVKIDG
jgi:hypothetical protein